MPRLLGEREGPIPRVGSLVTSGDASGGVLMSDPRTSRATMADDGRRSFGKWQGRLAFAVLLATTAPTVMGISTALPFGGGALRYTDILLPLAALTTLTTLRGRQRSLAFIALIAAALVMVVMGLYNEGAVRWMLRDMRPMAYLAFGLLVGQYLLLDRRCWDWCVKALAVYLGGIAALTLASQVTDIALVGRSANEVLYIGGRDIDLGARRAQFETNPLFLLILCSGVAAAVAGIPVRRWLTRGTYWTLIVSSVLVVFLSYSRNSVLALGAAVLLAIVMPVGMRRVDRLARLFAGSAYGALALAPVILAALSLGLFTTQLRAFDQRVVEGLSGSALRNDSSTRWRTVEQNLALEAVAGSPALGLGAGVFYRPSVPNDPFSDDAGKLYVHNYFVWLLVKGGVLGLGLVLLVLARGLAGLLMAREAPVAAVLGCGLGGILAASWVAPWAAQPNMAAVIGALIGVGIGYPATVRRPVLPAAGESSPATNVVAAPRATW